MTESEILFEAILTEARISFKKIPESTTDGEKRPDYLVGSETNPIFWEIKELNENPDEKQILQRINKKRDFCLWYNLRSPKT